MLCPELGVSGAGCLLENTGSSATVVSTLVTVGLSLDTGPAVDSKASAGLAATEVDAGPLDGANGSRSPTEGAADRGCRSESLESYARVDDDVAAAVAWCTTMRGGVTGGKRLCEVRMLPGDDGDDGDDGDK
jgi:hypothetical protein